MSALAVPVALVDDHQMVVLGLRTLFRARPEVDVVAFAHEPREALDRIVDARPRVAVLDCALGHDVDGFQLCRLVQEACPGIEVVFYTGVDELGIAEKGLAAGARGMVSKRQSALDLLRAVLLASRGKSYVAPAFAERAGPREFEELSSKQLIALRLLAKGLERKQIAEAMGIGEETVKTHVTEIRRKLRARTSAQAVAIGLDNALFEYD